MPLDHFRMLEIHSTGMERLATSERAETKRFNLTPRKPDAIQAVQRAQAQVAFLAAYAELGTLLHAAREVGIDRQTHYDWLRDCPDYAEMWEVAQEAYTEKLEREAGRRAVEGHEVGVWYQGEQVGTERKPSDNLLMFLLKARRPHIYRDRMELTGADGGPVQVQAVRSDALARLDPVQLAAIRALNKSVAGALPGDVAEDATAEVEPPEPPSTPDTQPAE